MALDRSSDFVEIAVPLSGLGSTPAACMTFTSTQHQTTARQLSEMCRALAEECRVNALLFGNEMPRAETLQIADDYDRKVLEAEELEATSWVPHDESPSPCPLLAQSGHRVADASSNL